MFATCFILCLLSPDVTPFAVLGFGCLMLVAITLFHGAGLDGIVSLYKGKSQKCLQSPWHPLMAQYFFGWTILLLLLLHLVDTTIWALVLNLTDLIPNIHESFYFSANTYTTLGYGNVPLPHAWRELSPIMAISGLFTFAWTTAQMFNLVGIHHDIVEEMSLNYHKRKELRRVERGQVQLVRTEEYEREKALAAQEKQEEAGLPFAERRKLKKAEKQKLRQLRDAANAEMEALRRQEREQERRLGRETPPDKKEGS
jgi:hypothetical protein